MTELAQDPEADPAQTSSLGNVRVTVLTDRLLRVEYAHDGVFEDRPTLAVVNRRFPSTPFDVRVDGSALTVDTGAIELHCSDVHAPFSAERLHARIRWVNPASGSAATSTTWYFGQPDEGNLGGTVRTLDTWKGNTTARTVGFEPDTGFVHEWDEQPLEPGLLSRDGWVVVDDSNSVVLDTAADGGRPWPTPRPAGERQDLYLFAHGSDHAATLQAGARLLGTQPLPPRYTFGYWYSRYYPYTDRELLDLAEQLDAHRVPVDVLVVDMDWHLPGWTGYSWDRDLFPDPTETLQRLHDRGLRVSLNLHPADGVGRHEDAFEAMCAAMGLAPQTVDRVPFDITDPRFVAAYFRLLHHPEEDRGVDFWWMDWQQGTDSPVPGLDPLAWLNHLHWDDQARRRPERRPLIFSRWGGLGAGRSPIGFSGDTHAVWESLAFQPEFTATAANVLYGYWSHDIGGHFGAPGPELYTRWVQFGAHSPVLRTHGSLGPDQERRLWEYQNPYRTVMIDAVRRRYELVPYLYGECRRGVDTGSSLVRPMYHHHPDADAALDAVGQYQLGELMIVAPVVSPLEDDSMAGVRVWLPEGEWFDVAHGARIAIDDVAGEWIERRYLLSEVPVFVRAGTVVPGQRDADRLAAPSYPHLVVTAYPGAHGSHELYEDDGVSTGYLRGESVSTALDHAVDHQRRTVRIGPARGDYPGWRPVRPVDVQFVGEAPPRSVEVDGDELPWAPLRRDGHWWYDAATASVVVSLPGVDLRRGAVVELARGDAVERVEVESLLDGYPGLARRLDMVSESTRTLLEQDNRQVIAVSQAVDRISRDPSTADAELLAVRRRLAGLDELLERYEGTWRELSSLTPTEPPVALDTLGSARRLLTTTRSQFSALSTGPLPRAVTTLLRVTNDVNDHRSAQYGALRGSETNGFERVVVRVAVTGSAGGMGRAVRRRLESDGATVLGIDVHDAEITADLSTTAGRDALADEVGRRCDGVLDGLVVAAGVQAADAATILSVNYFGAVATLDALRPLLARGTDPSAVAVVSNTPTTQPGYPAEVAQRCLDGDETAARLAIGDDALGAYPVSKLALARWLRRRATTPEWIGSGIRLNGIAPGFIDTPMTDGAWEMVASIGDVYPIPARRPGRPDEIAALVAFLLGPDAGFICGSIITIDGGTEAALRPDDWPRPMDL